MYIMKGESSSLAARFWWVGELIKKAFRIAEIFILLLLLTWTSARVPLAVSISGNYLRHLLSIVVSHLFIFFLSNAIVLVLFFKSRALLLRQYHAFQDHRQFHLNFCQELVTDGAGESFLHTEEIVYQEKRTIFEESKVGVHKRSQSENFSREKNSDCGRQLRRSETEGRRRVEKAEVVDELSNEEFQRAIEDFIAKQIKFHRQENFTIVLH